jgi:hypothetical protein
MTIIEPAILSFSETLKREVVSVNYQLIVMREKSLLVAVECIEYEENGGGNRRAHCQIWLKLYLSRRQNVAVVAGEIAELVLPVLLGGDEEIPW